MKPLLPLACLAAGVAIGWFAHPALHRNPEPVAAAPAPARPSPAVTASADAPAHPADRTSSGRPAKPDNEETKAAQDAKRKEAGKKQGEMMAKRITDIQRKKFEARLDKLAADLNLTPAQKDQIRAGMEKRFSTFGDLASDDTKDEGQKMKEVSSLLSTDGLDEASAGVLTDEQKDQYAAFKGKERQARIDSRALKDMGSITNVLDLTPDQRDGVYQAMTEQAAAREDSQKGGNVMSLFTEGMGIQFDDELGLQDVMQEQMQAKMNSGGNDPGALADIQKTMRDSIKQRTDARVEAIRPYVTDTQLQQYRSHLETKASSMLNMFGGAGGGE